MTTAGDAVTSAVIAAVSAQTGVSGDEIVGRRLRASTVEARFLVVYLLRVDYAMTLDRIGRLLDRDPSTVLSAVRQTQRRLRLETHLVETLDGIRAALRADSPGKSGDEDPGRPATSPSGPYTLPPRGMLHIPRRRPRRGPGVNRRRVLVLILVLAAALAAGAVRSRSAGTASGPVVSATEGLPPSPPSRANAATSPEAPAGPTTTTTYPRSATSAQAVPATTNAPTPAPTSPPVATLEEPRRSTPAVEDHDDESSAAVYALDPGRRTLARPRLRALQTPRRRDRAPDHSMRKPRRPRSEESRLERPRSLPAPRTLLGPDMARRQDPRREPRRPGRRRRRRHIRPRRLHHRRRLASIQSRRLDTLDVLLMSLPGDARRLEAFR